MSDGDGATLRVQLLGPVRAWWGDDELDLGGPRRRTVLAMLAAHPRRAVSRSELIDGVWGQEAPASAVNSVHVHVAGLRRVLEPRRAHRAPGQILAASGPGYWLRMESSKLDTEVLRSRLAHARRLTAAGDLVAAVQSLDAALGLWQGVALAGIPGPWADIERVRLGELRQTAVEERIDVMLALGGHHQALAELAGLIREYPLRERFHGQLMLAMYRCGRQADALAAFADARRVLAEQLGVDPGAELRRLHQQILTADASLGLPPGRVRLDMAGESDLAPSWPGRPTPVPRELPADVDTFIGRTVELAELDRLLTASRPRREADGGAASSAMAISAVAGSAGIGKTTLAVHWGHRVRDAFPDGQLYVNLRGYDPGEPMTVGEALARLLRSLGVADQNIPADDDERAARYRSLLDGRRMLVVLDNAVAVEQVRPLLPGVASCVVVVTSRDSLTGLVARDGARRLDLDLLPAGDAVRLLRELIGARVDADPAAAARLAAQCARLPLALRVAAELAAARPDLSLAHLADELAGEQRRLDLLDAGGDPHTGVRGVFSWSYRYLPADAARAFRLIGLHPGPDLDAYAAAALTSATVEHASGLLRLLARGHLIQPTGSGRYGMHDLLRAYARNLATMPGPEEAGAQDALTRLFDYYLAAAAAAMNTLVPSERSYRPSVRLPATPLPPVAAPAAARAWLDAERAVLVTAAGYAASGGWPGHATRLSAVLWRYLATSHYVDAAKVHTHACRAARRLGDRAAEAYALNYLGIIHQRLGRQLDAAACLRGALALFRELGDRLGEGLALVNLASRDRRQGRYPQAAAGEQQALALFRELGDRLGEAHALIGTGLTEWRQGRYPQAAGHFRQARVLYRDVGDMANEAHALSNLGMISGLLGRHREAVTCLQQALALFRERGYRTGEASALTDLGSVACQQGRHAEAVRYQEQALALFRELGERTGEVEALNGLGEALLAVGQQGQAYEWHAAACALARQIGEKHEQARAHNGLGAALLAAGQLDQAREQYTAALKLADKIGAGNEQGRARAGLHDCLAGRDAPAPARRARAGCHAAGPSRRSSRS
jgi:DNA-binding SARP family transcriptional activator/tetratricopeptide (TPR) repeat protein